MTNISQELDQIQAIEIQQFLTMGKLLEEADSSHPWQEEGLTRRQWLAGEGIPLRTANQARDLYYLLGETLTTPAELEGLTLNKLKLILPNLKESEGDADAQESLLDKTRTMLYNDLRDELHEKNVPEHECQWERKEKIFWECPICNERTYTNPNIKD